MEQYIKDTIVKYGWEILLSDLFQSGFDQIHHYKTTVGEHALGVTVNAVKLCFRYNLTDESTLSNVVTSCLCHDLSLIGRDGKYRNNLESLIRHPLHSAEIYTDLTGEEEERVLDAIRSHMFPLKPNIPKHREGWILTLADKMSSSKDILNISHMTMEEREELYKMAKKEKKRHQ